MPFGVAFIENGLIRFVFSHPFHDETVKRMGTLSCAQSRVRHPPKPTKGFAELNLVGE